MDLNSLPNSAIPSQQIQSPQPTAATPIDDKSSPSHKVLFITLLIIAALILLSIGVIYYVVNRNNRSSYNMSNSDQTIIPTTPQTWSTINGNLKQEITPCIKFNYPSAFTLAHRVVTTSQNLTNGVNLYGSSLLSLENNVSGQYGFAVIIECVPANTRNAQKSIAESDITTLKNSLSSDISSGKDPNDNSIAVTYDSTNSSVGYFQIQNNNNATQISEIFLSIQDSLWNIKEDVFCQCQTYFYRMSLVGSSKDKGRLKAVRSEFEDIVKNAILTNPLGSQ